MPPHQSALLRKVPGTGVLGKSLSLLLLFTLIPHIQTGSTVVPWYLWGDWFQRCFPNLLML
jgi:hypothetical protein